MITMMTNNVPNPLMLIKAGRLVHQVGNKTKSGNSAHRWASSSSSSSSSSLSLSSSLSTQLSIGESCSTRRQLINYPFDSDCDSNRNQFSLPSQLNLHPCGHHFLNNLNLFTNCNNQLINQHANGIKGYSSLYLTFRSFCSQTDKVFMPPEEFLQTKETSPDDPNSIKSGIKTANKSTEDVLFEMFEDSNGTVSVNKFFSALSATGLRVTDPRLKEIVSKLNVIWKAKQDAGSFEALSLDRETFKTVIRENIVLISRALRHHFVIPEFQEFCKQIEDAYWNCKALTGGKVANYIPQLAKYNPDYWGVTLCTIDGQRYAIGDTEIPFTIQSCGKPINYAIALSELGADIVHRYVGQEPSGRMFNELVLDHDNKPHNPMVNAGAIVICSLLLYMVEPEMRVSEKFDWVCNYFKSMAGDEYLGFSNATFLSEREAADRNYAIGYYMKENKCFPEKANLKEVMDFYFQMCSLEVNCPTVSVIAATLANGGICPITGQRVISSQAVRDVLSLMHSCGMYDYSGQFAFNVGLPAKSGVSGCTMVVVPNVMGMCLWSPPLDNYGNSVRGLEFCRELVKIFNFHHFDNLRHVPHKKDPRRQRFETKGLKIVSLLFSASSGDVSAMRRYYLSGMEMGLSDYDGRTALHLAASEGHLPCVEFLLKVCKVQPHPSDRWGHTPLDEAKRFNHTSVIEFLSKWEENKLGKELD